MVVKSIVAARLWVALVAKGQDEHMSTIWLNVTFSDGTTEVKSIIAGSFPVMDIPDTKRVTKISVTEQPEHESIAALNELLNPKQQ